jgi:hypothetical protein
MALYVCNGAKLKCSMGSREAEFCVIPTERVMVYIEENLIGTIMDNKPFVNIMPFGQCSSLANPTVAAATAACNGKLQKMPCVPNTVTPWIGGKMTVLVSDEPTILDNSKLMCIWAGMIEITNPGQDFVMEGAESLHIRSDSVESEENADDIAAVENAVASKEVKELTVKDFVEILEKVEEEQGYEAARHYASNRIDYWKVNKLAKRYVNETDGEKKEAEQDNDPNLMPSRFMLLYGADDAKLRGRGNVNTHPDNFDDRPAHEMCVDKLREALILFGNDIEKTGPFDDSVYFAFLKYLGQFNRVDLKRYFAEAEIEDGRLDRYADEHGLFSWKYFDDDSHSHNHDSVIKDLNPEYGDGLLSEKGVAPESYLPGICYQYPWGPFRLTVKLGEEYKDKEVKYQLLGCQSGILLADGEIEEPFKIEMLLPDAGELRIVVDDMEMAWSPSYGNLE